MSAPEPHHYSPFVRARQAAWHIETASGETCLCRANNKAIAEIQNFPGRVPTCGVRLYCTLRSTSTANNVTSADRLQGVSHM